MINQYFLSNARINDVPEINEHRAPTDESIKLLKEFEEKATQKIVDYCIIQDNIFNVNGCYFTFQCIGGYIIYFRFILNGKEYNFKETISSMDYAYDKLISLKKLYQLLSEEIAKDLMNNLLQILNENGEL